jgi:hypothetical protein
MNLKKKKGAVRRQGRRKETSVGVSFAVYANVSVSKPGNGHKRNVDEWQSNENQYSAIRQ